MQNAFIQILCNDLDFNFCPLLRILFFDVILLCGVAILKHWRHPFQIFRLHWMTNYVNEFSMLYPFEPFETFNESRQTMWTNSPCNTESPKRRPLYALKIEIEIMIMTSNLRKKSTSNIQWSSSRAFFLIIVQWCYVYSKKQGHSSNYGGVHRSFLPMICPLCFSFVALFFDGGICFSFWASWFRFKLRQENDGRGFQTFAMICFQTEFEFVFSNRVWTFFSYRDWHVLTVQTLSIVRLTI